jgi:putative ATPase
MDLFEYARKKEGSNSPLAERLKPVNLSEYVGQNHILGEGKMLRRLIEADKLRSIILYGPPGSGKTSLARVVANSTGSIFNSLNAVTSGVKDIREVVASAKESLNLYGKKSILFIDEIHRFNKSQQDALLPYVEDGTVILIGATTENPYYEVNNALISRSTMFRLEELETRDILKIINRAITDDEKGLGALNIVIDDDIINKLIVGSFGDARKALNALELASLTTIPNDEGEIVITEGITKDCLQNNYQGHDKSGDSHYDIASGLIKSMRGSDPDATLHYLAKLIVGGEDPKFIARRILICASEDVGNADPQALILATSAMKAVELIGMPEGRIILSQAAVYVATAPKSNSTYVAIDKAIEDVKNCNCGKMPYYLKDMTSLRIERKATGNMMDKNYLYPHEFENNYVEQQYLPDELLGRKYFNPTINGYEKTINERLESIRKEK